MTKKLKIINPWLINPFFGYSLFWSLAIILYILSPSKANLDLDFGLFLFLVITIIISAFFASYFNRKYNNNEIEVKYNRSSKIIFVILICLYLIEFIYSGQIPLFKTLFNNGEIVGAYKEFGLPTLHVIIVTFSLFYCIYNALMFDCFRKKSNLFIVIIIFCYFLLIYSRGVIIFSGISISVLFLMHRKITLKKWILIAILGLISAWLFGILGNIRSGSKWNDTSYLLNLAQIDANPKGLLSPLYWVDEYIICSLRNLNYNIGLNFNNSFEGFIYSIIPDFIAKRLFTFDNQIELVIEGLTTTTMYAKAYTSAGWFGMFTSFLLYLGVLFLIMEIEIPNQACKLACFSMLFFLYSLSIFDNMLTYSGYSFSLVFALIYGVCFNRKKLSKSNVMREVMY